MISPYITSFSVKIQLFGFDLSLIKKGNSHELPNSIFVNLKSNTIMKKLLCKDKRYFHKFQIFTL